MSLKEGNIVQFGSKNYQVVNPSLGSGSFGKTISIKDTDINELFVAKKYEPEYPQIQEMFYTSFIKEIKIMHKLYHENVVRIFNYYLIPEAHTGYIIMEYVQGSSINNMLEKSDINKIFMQLVNAFSHLERHGILHRDIRSSNILVDDNSNVKIIDFGLGKIIESNSMSKKKDSHKNNINREDVLFFPNEEDAGIYDHQTDMFYIAELLSRLMKELHVTGFNYEKILNKMMQQDPENRYKTFNEVLEEINKEVILEFDAPQSEKAIYLNFCNVVLGKLNHFTKQPKFSNDVDVIIKKLETILKEHRYENFIQNNSKLIDLFILGGWNYKTATDIPVDVIKEFYIWFKSLPSELQNIIIKQINLKLDKKSIKEPESKPPDLIIKETKPKIVLPF